MDYARIIALPEKKNKKEKNREVLLVSQRKRGDEIITKRTSQKEREKQRKLLEHNETCAN